MTGCKGPGRKAGKLCGGKVIAHGLCFAHYHQSRRHPGEPLKPLQRPRLTSDVPLEAAGVRVLPAVRKAMLADPKGAREVLTRWVLEGMKKP